MKKVLLAPLLIKVMAVLLLVPLPALTLNDSVVSHLSEAIQFRTVSYEDLSLMDSTQCCNNFDKV
jgi:hypothetical protein